MESVNKAAAWVAGSQIVQMARYYNDRYVVSAFQKTEFTAHLVEHLPSRIVTLTLVYGGLLLALYELVLNGGVYLGLWPHPADEVFEEIPVHCAHVYVSIRVMVDSEGSEDRKSLLEHPIVYHFEFSPDEYAHEDYGTDLRFLRQKVHDWFMSSQVYYLHKGDMKDHITLEDVRLYNRRGVHLQDEDAYLCDLDVNTGDTVICTIQGK